MNDFLVVKNRILELMSDILGKIYFINFVEIKKKKTRYLVFNYESKKGV